eukprot:3557015-Alexandrium_andersonii.AAC.1
MSEVRAHVRAVGVAREPEGAEASSRPAAQQRIELPPQRREIAAPLGPGLDVRQAQIDNLAVHDD